MIKQLVTQVYKDGDWEHGIDIGAYAENIFMDSEKTKTVKHEFDKYVLSEKISSDLYESKNEDIPNAEAVKNYVHDAQESAYIYWKIIN